MKINHTDLEDLLKKDLETCSKEHDLQQIKSKYLGKKGHVTILFSSLKDIPSEERKAFGSELNNLKQVITKLIDLKFADIKRNREITQRLDLDTPARHHQFGSHHPISLVIRRIEKIFSNFGFETHEGPEIETEYYNFESLNIADNHPARDMHDTFYFDNNLLLRTHTSSVQIHAMENRSAPLRVLAPGRVYRCDSDPTLSLIHI